MNEIVDIIEKIVEQKLREMCIAEIGIVTEVFPHKKASDFNNYSCNVRLKNPDAEGNFLELRKVPIATGHVGTVAIPNVGDMVMISFVQGSVHQPIITGRLYHSEMRPPIGDVDEIVQELPPGEKPEKNIQVIARNHPKEKIPREILVDMKPKLKIHADETELLVEVHEGKIRVNLKREKENEGQIEISTQKTMVKMKENGDIEVSTPENITLKAKKDIMIEAENVKIQSRKNTEIETGKKFTTKSKTSQTHEAANAYEITSKSSTIKASGPVKVEGSIIDLN